MQSHCPVLNEMHVQLEIRSVEQGICPTMTLHIAWQLCGPLLMNVAQSQSGCRSLDQSNP